MSDNHVIPEAAVEAAAKVTFEHTNFGNPWGAAGMAWKVAYREAARAALEAAAPHMLAESWDAGYTTCEIDSPYEPDTPNPYR